MKTFGPTMIAFVTALVGLYKYFQEKNRTMYERRLNEVYAPLYGFLTAQETFRQLYLKDLPIHEAPILTMEKKKVQTTVNLSDGTTSVSKSVKSIILDRKNFINTLNKTNMGLAKPDLLIAIKQYEMLVYLEENTNEETDEWREATNKKVEIEYKLFKAIVSGYSDTIYTLGLDGIEEVLDLEVAKL